MFLEPNSNVNHQLLLDNLEYITQDYHWINNHGYLIDFNNIDDMLSNPKNTNHFWQAFPLIYNKNPWPHTHIDVKELKTYKLIRELLIQPILATFSVLLPNSDIKDHEDHDEDCIANSPDNSVVKYHYGIIVKGNCGLRVGNDIETVKEGKLNIFRESITHSAFNYSDTKRVALILSFLESDLAPSSVSI